MVPNVEGATLARRRIESRVRVADLLVDSLVDAQFEYAFGIPGGPIAPIYDSLLDTNAIHAVLVRHENHGIFAASAYARHRGRPALVLVTSGPGVLNCVNGLASAKADHCPLVLLVGEVPREFHGRNALQDGSEMNLGVLNVLSSVTKHVSRLADASSAVGTLERAISIAMQKPCGPVAISCPIDVLSAETLSTMRLSIERGAPAPRTNFSAIEEALNRSGSTVVLVGNGARDCPRGALLELVERLGATVVTSPKGKGVFPETHRAHAGVLGVGGHDSARIAIESRPETVLVLGSSLGDLTTSGWSIQIAPSRNLIHVDADSSQIGRNYPATLGAESTVEAFVEAVCPVLVPRASPYQPRTPLLRHAIEEKPGSTKLHPARAIEAIQKLMPDDTIYSVDSGEHYFFASHYLKSDSPDNFFASLGLGSMGSGFCGALGLQLAAPQRTVVSICGDGGFAMSLGEISTAASEGLPIRWVVFNDGHLGMVEHGHASIFGRSPDFRLGSMDVVAAAKALGADAFRVKSLDDLHRQRHRLLAATGPVVVDVEIDGDVTLPKNGRFSSLGNVVRTNSEANI